MNTHNKTIEFGKHKGERWTWMLNTIPEEKEAWSMDKAELSRRGDTMPTEVEVSNHAIDKASLRVRKAWHSDRGEDDWLARISTAS